MVKQNDMQRLAFKMKLFKGQEAEYKKRHDEIWPELVALLKEAGYDGTPVVLTRPTDLAAIAKLAFDVIPQDPSRSEYRQGATLGTDRKHWFRAKFFQQYRLFFRYHAGAKMIVYAWVNDDDTKRAYESSDDAYRVFRKMLESGHPPDDWDQLLGQAELAGNRLMQALNTLNIP